MTAYEVHQYTSTALNTIMKFRAAIKAGQVKEKDLEPSVQFRITPEYEAKMIAAQKRSLAQIELELKAWYE